jgi:hypothetical protein
MNQGTQTARSETELAVDRQPSAENGKDLTTASDNHVELKYRSVANFASGNFAKGLGVFSIALGLAEILAPARVGTMMGVGPKHRAFLPLLGAREIAHGLAIFQSAKPTGAVWSRVGGDMVDLAYLGSAFMSKESNKTRLAGATIAILGATAMDLMCAKQLSGQDWNSSSNPKAPTTVGQSSAR